MALCTVSEVKALVSPKKISDAEISALIDVISILIVGRVGGAVSDSGDADKKTAAIFLTCSSLIRKMKFSGELAANIKIGNSQQQNAVDTDIENYDKQAEKAIKKIQSRGFSVIYNRVGPGTVDST